MNQPVVSRILFENANVFDGDSAKVIERASVLIEGNEIQAVARERLRAEGARRIDCSGKTLMPGMIDNHLHVYCHSLKFTPPDPPVTYRAQYAHRFLTHILSCGFTTVRDVAGGDHGMAMALRDGFIQGPRFFYGGLALSQTGGHGDFRTPDQPTDYLSCAAERNVYAIVVDGVDACRKAVREELRKGAHHIKIMGSGGIISTVDPLERCQYSESEIRVMVEEATRHGAYVCAHCHPAEAIRRCVDLGVRSIEHGTMIDAPTAAFVAERGAYVVPTMAVIFALLDDGVKMGMQPASYEKLLRVSESAIQGLEIMKREGVRMGFGTDLIGYQHTRQGTEFSLRKRALSAFDVLHSATAMGAEILQMKGKLGVVKPGALADLLVVEGNPLEDIELLAANGKYLTHIMSDGKFVKQPEQDKISGC